MNWSSLNLGVLLINSVMGIYFCNKPTSDVNNVLTYTKDLGWKNVDRIENRKFTLFI